MLQIFLYAIAISTCFEIFLVMHPDKFKDFNPLEKKFANLVYLKSQVSNLMSIFNNHSNKERELFVDKYTKQIHNYRIISHKVNYKDIEITAEALQAVYSKHKDDEVIEFSVAEVAGNMQEYVYFQNSQKQTISNIPYFEVINYLDKISVYSEKTIPININSKTTKIFQVKPIKKFICSDFDAAENYLRLIAQKEVASKQIISDYDYSKEFNVTMESNNIQLFAELQGKQEGDVGMCQDWDGYIYYKVVKVYSLNFIQVKKLRAILSSVYNEYCNQFLGIQVFEIDKL